MFFRVLADTEGIVKALKDQGLHLKRKQSAHKQIDLKKVTLWQDKRSWLSGWLAGWWFETRINYTAEPTVIEPYDKGVISHKSRGFQILALFRLWRNGKYANSFAEQKVGEVVCKRRDKRLLET